MAKERVYRFKEGDISKDLKILNQISYIRNDGRNEKGYTVICVNCGYSYDMFETSLTKGCGCKICNGNHVIIKGINDIATTNPEMIPYFVNSNDVYIYSFGSNKSTLMKCPDCGHVRKIKISNLYNKGFNCNKCGDGFSYPNKFMFNMLSQLNVDFIPEYSPEFIKPKRYDFYLPSENLIIEMDGGFHYRHNNMNGQTAQESVRDDTLKDEKAIQHGLEVIRIDCDYGKNDRSEYLKNNILTSALYNLLNLKHQDMDWMECHTFSSKNISKTICDLWNSGEYKSITELSNYVKINYSTTLKYLKKWSAMGLCHYDMKISEETRIKNSIQST